MVAYNICGKIAFIKSRCHINFGQKSEFFERQYTLKSNVNGTFNFDLKTKAHTLSHGLNQNSNGQHK